MRSTTMYALLALLLASTAAGCGDDGPGTVTVGDSPDAGKDAGEEVNHLIDGGKPILGGGCDASAGTCSHHENPHPNHIDGDGGEDGGADGG